MTPGEHLEALIARIWSRENLNEIAFTEGNIMYQQLWRIDQLANPKFYTQASLLEATDYQPPHSQDVQSEGEEEEEEEVEEGCPLPIPDQP